MILVLDQFTIYVYMIKRSSSFLAVTRDLTYGTSHSFNITQSFVTYVYFIFCSLRKSLFLLLMGFFSLVLSLPLS